MTSTENIAERLLARVEYDTNGGCWLWSGSLNPGGYGRVHFRWKDSVAHRVSYEAFVGRIGSNFVLHKCDTPSCINPAHLFLGSHAENMADMKRKGRQSRAGAPKGEQNHRAELTDDDVRLIRASSESSRQLAKRLPVTDCMIRRIRRGLAWAHVTPEAGAHQRGTYQ